MSSYQTKGEKIFVGNGKEIPTSFGSLLKLSFSAEDISRLQQNLENGWVNVVVKKRKTPSERGITHYLEIDQWKRESSQQAPDISGEEVSVEDLPF